MNRHALLYEITGVMGDVLAACEAEGIALDERSIRIFCDRFSAAYLALSPPASRDLAEAVHLDEVRHGGLLSRETLRLANVVQSDSRFTR